MANGQIDHLIEDATDRLAEEGKDADLRDVMLAGFGYVVREVRRPQSLMEGKKGFAAGGVVGGTGIGIVDVFLRFLGV